MPHSVERAVPLDPPQCVALVASERWQSRVQIEESGCIRWIGYIRPDGYGETGLGRQRRFLAHRVAWVAANGTDITRGLTMDHLCRNRWCVNPDHLEPVTVGENTRRGDPGGQRAKTHCPAGHPLEGDNLIPSVAAHGWRGCRTCNTERSAEQNRLIAAAARGLGLTLRQYRAEYTQSRVGLEQILDSLQIPAWTPPSAAAIHAAEVWLLEGATA